ncbi:tRNA (adenosine(37)-N6)-threonylcarbamoyltransferase complex dimerization subunit type 1 TsaB [Alicyclobacillus suci]|uniref:tRNA (adenosine(37)-N6)-threonylcarbamoyltransferase complex dimerization subunit type 1 TsaB n=1 Tax=Alicyclobacillus suci TaxID=2816080 RepID=UPI001A908D3E|nr:tRNA (adenosine(37)-N6)-threonylcarbamoyltransferase complex dimerization subunit type 1 TsaB [Alicyclobacillus suci]
MGVIVMDTATDAMAVAAGHLDGTLLSAVTQRVPRGHSRLLQPSISFVMQSAGFHPWEVERIGVGVGPGSYTGVRMAVATGKAMAHVLQVPLIAVPTLDAIALAAGLGVPAPADGAEVSVLVLLFARRHRAFGAWFTVVGGRLASRSEAQVQSIADWLAQVPAHTSVVPAVLVHDFPPDELALVNLSVDLLPLSWGDVSTRFADALFRLALRDEYPVFAGERIHTVLPDYALPVEAEVKLELRQKGGERP